MATVSHHHHAMRSYLQCHNQPLPSSSSPPDRSTDTTTNAVLGGGNGAAAGVAMTISSAGGTAVPTVPYFYPTTNQVRLLYYESLSAPSPK